MKTYIFGEKKHRQKYNTAHVEVFLRTLSVGSQISERHTHIFASGIFCLFHSFIFI